MPKYRRGSGSIYRRGKMWWLSYYVNGRHVCESAETKDKEAARTQLRVKLGQKEEGRLLIGADKVKFDDLADAYLTDYRVNARKSLSDAERRVKNHLKPFFAGRRAHALTTLDVQTYIEQRQGEEAENGTINRELAALKRMFNLALHAGKIARKPYIPMLQEHNVRSGFFEQSQFEALLTKLPAWLRPPMTFAYLTGWRARSEVFPLEWSTVDLDTGTVRLEPGTTKNGDGRLIYLTDELQGLLQTQWQEHQARFPECQHVFQRNGKRIRYPYVAWRSACEKAGLVGSIPHDFRRTAVRNMVRAGIPERVAMQMAGHKTRSIFDRYHIVAESDLREAAQRLNGALRTRTATVLATVDSSEGEQPTVTH